MDSEHQKQENETSEMSTEESTRDWNVLYEDHHHRYVRIFMVGGSTLLLNALALLGVYVIRLWTYTPKVTFAIVVVEIILGIIIIFLLMYMLSRKMIFKKISMRFQLREREGKLFIEIEKDIDAILRQGMPNGR